MVMFAWTVSIIFLLGFGSLLIVGANQAGILITFFSGFTMFVLVVIYSIQRGRQVGRIIDAADPKITPVVPPEVTVRVGDGPTRTIRRPGS